MLIASDQLRIVIGLGKTGLSCARFLAGQGLNFAVADSRRNPPGLAAFTAEFPEADVYLGDLANAPLNHASELIVSPGLSLHEPAIAAAIAAGAQAIGDIELFARARNSAEKPVPLIAITGSNAKSTVTTLVGEMARAAGLKVGVGGNIGTPALELLDDDYDLYVLELSSFQLDTTHSLKASVATVLNISDDHMDRYSGIADYHRAKHRIFRGAGQVLINRDDALTIPLVAEDVPRWSFGLADGAQTPLGDNYKFALRSSAQGTFLTRGNDQLMNVAALKIQGAHNHANALAALALGSAVNLPMPAMLQALEEFTGLEHRCQWLCEIAGVTYINDSKATNVGAALAAIEGLGACIEGRILLIAGGVGKGADFSGMSAALQRYVKGLILIGEDAQLIAEAGAGLQTQFCQTLEEATAFAHAHACAGDVVLLSPACASFDMFTSFEHRGTCFVQAVEALRPILGGEHGA